MSIQLPAVNTAGDVWQNLIDKLNGVINTVANSVMTANTNANGATTTGNAFIIGTMGATTLVANTLRGGNVQSSSNLTIASNAFFTGNLITLGANLTINSSSMVIGANLVLTDSLMKFGNSTVNAVLNSTALVFGPNSFLTGTSLAFGNSTVNAVVNTTGVSISGASLVSTAFRDSVAIAGTLVGTGSRINFSGSGSTSVAATVDVGNNQVNVVISSTLVLANGAGGSNTSVLYNNSNGIGGSAGFTFDSSVNNAVLANTLTVGTTIVNSSIFFAGNSTVNTSANSTVDSFSNSTTTSSYGLAGLNVGGVNIVNTTVFFSGNSTINSVSNSTIDIFSNSTVASSIGIGGLIVGANVSVGPSGPSYGNSTINVVANSTAITLSGSSISSLNSIALALGANLAVNTSFFLLGNSTVSWTGNSTQIQIANSTIAVIANSTGIVVGSNVSVTYQQITVGTSTMNTAGISAASYLGAGIANTLNYFANTAGKVVTTDMLNLSGAYVTLADGATISWDHSTGINFQVTLGGNRTLANPTNPVIGRSGILQVIEPATGSCTISFGNGYFFDSDVAPVISTGNNKINFLYYHNFAVGKTLITLAAKGV
jgi:hypothetical protein